MSQSRREYLKPGRLEDILALIQVLNSEGTLQPYSLTLLQEDRLGEPKSVKSWAEVALQHREFFRACPSKNGDHALSLLARFVQNDPRPPVRSETIELLFKTAIDIHDRQVRQNDRKAVWIPLLAALIPGVIAFLISIMTLWFK